MARESVTRDWLLGRAAAREAPSVGVAAGGGDDVRALSPAMRAVHTRFFKRFLPTMAGYCALIGLYGWLVPRTDSQGLRAVLAMLPMLLAMRALALVIREQDELERQTDLQALAVAAVLTSCGFLSFGLMLSAEMVRGVSAAMVALMVLPCFFWVFGLAKLALVLRLRSR